MPEIQVGRKLLQVCTRFITCRGYSRPTVTSSNKTVTGEPQLRPHTPVLLREVLEVIQPQNGKLYLDMTFGAGGHTEAILRVAPNATVFGLDRDPVAQRLAADLATKSSQFIPLHGKFSEVHHLLAKHGVKPSSLDGVLLDVGASSMQFDDPERGFGLSHQGPLDMRMDAASQKLSAADIVNRMDETDLFQILKHYGEEKKARLIARAIVDHRYAFGTITTTAELAQIVVTVYESTHGKDKLRRPAHVATKTFQALRIFVNDELNELYNGLEIAHALLRPQGVCAAIAFHSLEDRIIKRCFHGIDMDAKLNMSITDQMRNSAKIHDQDTITNLLHKKWEPLSKKVVTAAEDEIDTNPRARSAKLRAAVKLEISP